MKLHERTTKSGTYIYLRQSIWDKEQQKTITNNWYLGKSAGEARDQLKILQQQGVSIPIEIFAQIANKGVGNHESIQKEIEKTHALIKVLKDKAVKTNTSHSKNVLYKAVFELEELLQFEERFSYRDCPVCKYKTNEECIRTGCSFVRGYRDQPCLLFVERYNV
jgi:hypothetical protein